VGLPGLEPGTSSLSVKRSNRLSYSPSTSKTLPEDASFSELKVYQRPGRTITSPAETFTEMRSVDRES
jgi:hypothetical protein